ncbi:MAG: YetF domain-containing protein [Rhodospirillales bacterium]
MSDPIFFDSWLGMLRIVVVGIAAYAVLILMLRISGKRTLSKMNAFDLVVTVALGSTLSTVLLDASVPLLEGIMALALLIFLQFAITWLAIRSDRFQNLIKSEPTLLVHESRYLDASLRQQRVTRGDIGAALRESGMTDVSEVQTVVLESDGSITVIPRGPGL